MADQRIQHVLVKFLTEVDTKGVSASKGAFTDLDKQVQNITQRLKTAYDQAKKNKTDLSKIDFDLKALKQFSDGIKKVSEQDLTKLADTEKQVFKQLLEDTEKQVAAIEKEIAVGEKRTETLEGFLHGVDSLTPLLGQYGAAVSGVTRQTLELIDAHKRGELSSTGFGKALKALSNPLVALAAAAAAFVGVALEETLRTNGQAADDLSAKWEGLKSAGFEAVKGVASLGKALIKLVKLDLKGAQDEFFNFALSFGSLKKAFELGDEAGQLQNALEDNIRAIELQNAKLETLIAKNREIISEEATVFGDITEKRKALNVLKAAESQLAANNLKLAKEEKRVLEEKLVLQKFDLNNLPDEQANQINKAQIKILQAQEAASNLERLINRIEKGINAQDDQLFNQQADRINKAFEFAQKIKTGQLVDFTQLKTDKDKLIKENEIQGFIQELIDLRNEVLKESFGKSQSDKDNANNFAGFVDDVVHGLTQSYDAVFQSIEKLPGADITKKRLQSEVVKSIEDVEKSIKGIQFNDKKPSLFERLFGFGKDGEANKKRTQEALNSFGETSKQALQTFYETEIAKTDFLIEQQQRRVDEINKIAADGNAEQLKLEEERLERLANQREEFAKRLQVISAIEIGASVGSSIAQYVSLVVKESLFKDPIVAIAETLALIGAIASGVASIRKLSVQGFELGDEYVTETGRNKPGPSDTIPALLTPGERVVPSSLNAKLGGIPNPELVNAVEAYRAPTIYQTKRFSSKSDDILLKQNKLIEENTKAIQDMRIHLDVDMDSYHVTQAKRQKGEARRKRLARTR